jgi:hypothetical protein
MADTQPRTLKDFGELTKAEQQVLAELDTGEVIWLGNGEVAPGDACPERPLPALAVAGLSGIIKSD